MTLYQALRELPLTQLGHVYASQTARKQLEAYLDLQIDAIIEYPLKTRQFLRSMAYV